LRRHRGIDAALHWAPVRNQPRQGLIVARPIEEGAGEDHVRDSGIIIGGLMFAPMDEVNPPVAGKPLFKLGVELLVVYDKPTPRRCRSRQEPVATSRRPVAPRVKKLAELMDEAESGGQMLFHLIIRL
jgi:hypothetical protein